MQRFAVVLLVAAVGCGARAPRTASTSPASPASPATAPASPTSRRTPGNGELLAALAPTGATWEQAVARVPPDRARAVAITFLRDGNFACRALVDEEIGCGDTTQVFAPVEPSATLADPCLRRLVAGWALSQLEATDIPAVDDALAAIVALPFPEQQLADAVVTLVPPGDDRLRLRLVEAALAGKRDDVADALLPGLTPAGIAQALVELHRESALALLGPDDPTPSGAIAAALDDGLSPAAALDALDHLEVAHLADAGVRAAVIRQATSADCPVAARAALLLDAGGDPQYLPSRMALTDEATATRALCVAANVSPAEARSILHSLVSADGLDLVDVDHTYMNGPEIPDPDLDEDHDPYTHTTRAHVDASALDHDGTVDWLPTICDGAQCEGPTGTVTFAFGPGAGHALALEEIRVERADSGCGC
jgi:hypothetical protein